MQAFAWRGHRRAPAGILSEDRTILIGVAAASLVAAAILARNGAPTAVMLAVAVGVVVVAASRRAWGLCLAVAVVLAVPQTVPHIWLVPAIASAVGLLAGTA